MIKLKKGIYPEICVTNDKEKGIIVCETIIRKLYNGKWYHKIILKWYYYKTKTPSNKEMLQTSIIFYKNVYYDLVMDESINGYTEDEDQYSELERVEELLMF